MLIESHGLSNVKKAIFNLILQKPEMLRPYVLLPLTFARHQANSFKEFDTTLTVLTLVAHILQSDEVKYIREALKQFFPFEMFGQLVRESVALVN